MEIIRKWVSDSDLYRRKTDAKAVAKTKSLPNLKWNFPEINRGELPLEVVEALYAGRQFLPKDLYKTEKRYFSPGILFRYFLTIIPFIDHFTDYLNAGMIFPIHFYGVFRTVPTSVQKFTP